MQIVRSILLAIACLALLTLSVFQLSKRGLDQVIGRVAFSSGDKLFAISPDLVEHVRIEQGNSVVLASADRSKGGIWWAKKPWDDRLDPRAMAAIFHFTNSTYVVDSIPLKQHTKLRLREYGLSGDAVNIRLLKANRKELANFSLGHATPLLLPNVEQNNNDASCYLRSYSHGREDEILVTAGNIRPIFNDSLRLLRDHRPLLLHPQLPQSIHISTSAGQLLLERPEWQSPWRIKKPLDLSTDAAATNSLLACLQKLTALKLENLDESTRSLLPQQPKLSISVQNFAQKEPVVLNIYPAANPSDNVVPATVSDRPGTLFYLPRQAQHELIGVEQIPFKINQLRSRTLVDFDRRGLQGITIKAKDYSAQLQRPEGGKWQLELFADSQSNKFGSDFNEQALYNILATLLQNPVEEYSSDTASELAPYGLDQPLLSIYLEFEDGKLLRVNFGKNAQGQFFANLNNSTSIARISAEYLLKVNPSQQQWRSTRLFNFNALDLQRIELHPAGTQHLQLDYNSLEDSWTAWRIDNSNAQLREDLSYKLNPNRASYLMGYLGNLRAQSWYDGERQAALQALSKPLLKVVLHWSEEQELQQIPMQEALSIAAMGNAAKPLFYYGRLDSSSDIFLLSAEQFQVLAASLLDN